MEMIQKVKENKFILKMVVLGDVGVGKSNIQSVEYSAVL